MFYNLESDFGNGCNTCEEVPQMLMQQQPQMSYGTQPQTQFTGQQMHNPYAMQAPQQPNVAPQMVQQAPQKVVVQHGEGQDLDTATRQAALYVNNPPTVATDATNVVEGFGVFDNLVAPNLKTVLLFVLIVLSALAVNECSKYYLNKAIQNCDGDSYHYLVYGVVALFLLVVLYKFL